jgi:hypothetical protein
VALGPAAYAAAPPSSLAELLGLPRHQSLFSEVAAADTCVGHARWEAVTAGLEWSGCRLGRRALTREPACCGPAPPHSTLPHRQRHSEDHSGHARRCAGTPLTRPTTAARARGCAHLLACARARAGAHLLVAQRPGGDQARAVAQRGCRARGRLARHLRGKRRAGPAPGASLHLHLIYTLTLHGPPPARQAARWPGVHRTSAALRHAVQAPYASLQAALPYTLGVPGRGSARGPARTLTRSSKGPLARQLHLDACGHAHGARAAYGMQLGPTDSGVPATPSRAPASAPRRAGAPALQQTPAR